MKIKAFWLPAAALTTVLISGMGLQAQQARIGSGFLLEQDLTRFLDEKEQRYLIGAVSPNDLNEEELQHVQRILRLQQLRQQEDVVFEPAGAQSEETQPAAAPEKRVVQDIAENEPTGIELRRENEYLRSELQRLQHQVDAMDFRGSFDVGPYQSPEKPRFYLPVR